MTSTLDITALLEQRVPAALLGAMRQAAALATARDLPLYLVGGLVRDVLLGRSPLDADVTVEGDAIALAEELALEVGGEAVTHPPFGTARVTWDNLALDLAMARTETYAQPGALPVVRPANLHEDLLRRDFSMNALAIRLDGPHWGQLIDPAGGLSDLRAGLVRVLHPQSFQDDPTRLFRAVRYAARLGFRIEADTVALAGRDAEYISRLSSDRLRREISLILEEAIPERSLFQASELGLLTGPLSALRMTLPVAVSFASARGVSERPSPALYLCLLTFDATEGERAALVDRLRFPRDQAQALTHVQLVRQRVAALDVASGPPSAVAAALDGTSDVAVLAVELRSSEPVRRLLMQYRQEWRTVRPRLSGHDLQDIGVARGPLVREMLARLRAARLDGLARTEDEERRLVQEWLTVPRTED